MQLQVMLVKLSQGHIVRPLALICLEKGLSLPKACSLSDVSMETCQPIHSWIKVVKVYNFDIPKQGLTPQQLLLASSPPRILPSHTSSPWARSSPKKGRSPCAKRHVYSAWFVLPCLQSLLVLISHHGAMMSNVSCRKTTVYSIDMYRPNLVACGSEEPTLLLLPKTSATTTTRPRPPPPPPIIAHNLNFSVLAPKSVGRFESSPSGHDS